MKKIILLSLIILAMGCANISESLSSAFTPTKSITVPLGFEKAPLNSEDTMLWILIYTDYKEDNRPYNKTAGWKIDVSTKKSQFGTPVAISSATNYEEFMNELQSLYPQAFNRFLSMNNDAKKEFSAILYDMDNSQSMYDYTQFFADYNNFYGRYIQLYSAYEAELKEKQNAQALKAWKEAKVYSVNDINTLYKQNAAKFISEWSQPYHKLRAKIDRIEVRWRTPVIVFYVARPVYKGIDVVSITNIVCNVDQKTASSLIAGQTIDVKLWNVMDWNMIWNMNITSGTTAYDYSPGDLFAKCEMPK